MLEQFISQLLALATLFLFPALQYLFLKWSSRKEGAPELWYLPRYVFRLVIRNLPRKRTLSEIRYRAYLRKVVAKGGGSSVATYVEHGLIDGEEMFLFRGIDHLLLCFRLEGDDIEQLELVVTDKLGVERERYPLASFDRMIAEYTANIENFLNFDIRLAKQAQLYTSTMKQIWQKCIGQRHDGM